jgi:hypothetical protein
LSQPSPDTDDDWDGKATEALEAARLIPAGKEKSEAMKRAGLAAEAYLTGCKGSACDGK